MWTQKLDFNQNHLRNEPPECRRLWESASPFQYLFWGLSYSWSTARIDHRSKHQFLLLPILDLEVPGPQIRFAQVNTSTRSHTAPHSETVVGRGEVHILVHMWKLIMSLTGNTIWWAVLNKTRQQKNIVRFLYENRRCEVFLRIFIWETNSPSACRQFLYHVWNWEIQYRFENFSYISCKFYTSLMSEENSLPIL